LATIIGSIVILISIMEAVEAIASRLTH